METEPVIPQFAQMQFNLFGQNFGQNQEHQQMLLLQHQYQLHHQQQTQQIHLQDEEMEADDTTNDMKYNENDMNQMNITLNSVSSNNKQLNQYTQDNQQFNVQQAINQQATQAKFGRLIDNSKQIENLNSNLRNKQLEEEDYDDEYDEEDDEDDLDDYDEDLIREMMLGASPESQNIIKLIISGFSACASETLRYLIEEENLSANSPVMLGLIEHLKVQETMLIVNCLRTQQFQHQLIKQQQQLSSMHQAKQNNLQLKKNNKQFEPELTLNQSQPVNHQALVEQQIQQQMNKNSQNPSEIVLHNNSQSAVNNQSQIINNQVNVNNQVNNSHVYNNSTNGPLTSSPINKPFDTLTNANNLNQVSNFSNTLQLAFSGHSNANSVNNSQNSSQNSSAQSSHSSSPVNTPPFYSQNLSHVTMQRQVTNTRPNLNTNNPFAGVFNSNTSASNIHPNSSNTHFYNQNEVLTQFKPPFNDSGFSE